MTSKTETASVTLERKAGHYDIDGILYPSATTILQVINKPALMGWYGKIGTEEANRIKQESADFGKTVHELIQAVLDGKEIDFDKTDEIAGGCIKSFQEWVRLVNFKPLLTEHTVYSKEHGYAGTLDCVGLVYGVPALIDWKTSSGIYPEMTLQVAAYDRAVRELELADPKMHLIVRFDKKTKRCHPQAVSADQGAFEAFLNAKNLWTWLQGAGKPATNGRG